MSRFYERYAHTIIWALTGFLGVGIAFWTVGQLAEQGIFPEQINGPVVAVRKEMLEIVAALAGLVHRNGQFLGGIATLGTFIFGLVQGILYARRQLPTRLMTFMTAELQPVYANTDAVLSAVALRSANVAHGSVLFHRGPLDRALDSLAGPWRPRKKESLTETIKEIDRYIAVTKHRLTALREVKSHAQILRGAIESYDCITSGYDRSAAIAAGTSAEADFSESIKVDATKVAALELRGLLRSRIGNPAGAQRDFEQLKVLAEEKSDDLLLARAIRLQAEVLMRKSNGAKRLQDAQGVLNTARRTFNDGRTLSASELLELALNRQTYGQLKERLQDLNDEGLHLALQAYEEALTYCAQVHSEQAAMLKFVLTRRLADLRNPKCPTELQ